MFSVALVTGLAALTVLLSRLRINPVRRHPHNGRLHRLLIVLDTDVDASELAEAVAVRAIARRLVVRLVAPTLPSTLHLLYDDDAAEHEGARLRLRTAKRALAEIGIRAEGRVGAADPLQAAADAVAAWPADEILFVAPLPSRRRSLERELELKARDLLGLPVGTVYAR